MEANTIRIALAGNPNTGKTTLFNALTGSNQFVGNWPGVTVEKKEGKLKNHEGGETVIVTDLPGIYSLSPYTLEEVVARNYLVVECPDAILNIIDGTNLERNLYLTTQLTELGIPVVMAINMVDVLRKQGDKIDLDALSRRMGCPAVEISALKGTGLDEAVALAIETAKHGRNVPHHIFSGEVEHTLAHIEEAAVHGMPADRQRWYAIKIFERDEKVLAELNLDPAILSHIEEDIKETERLLDDDAEAIIINERYNYITGVLQGCFKRKHVGKLTASEKIDKVVTNRIAALPIFAAIMFLVYYISVSTVGTFVTDWMNDGVFGDGWHLFGIGSKDYTAQTEEYAGAAEIIDNFVAYAEEQGLDTSAYNAAVEAKDAEGIKAALTALDEQISDDVTVTWEYEDEETFETLTSSATGADFTASISTALGYGFAEPDPADYGVWVVGVPVLVEKGLVAANSPEWLNSLILDGIVGGVGAVLGFVPQILVLFILLAFLEACGYMSRIAFVLDRIFRKFGLSGKSFIPILIGTGCGVPGIMASRTIENERDRRMTIITTTFIPCGAKLPIIAMIAATLFGNAWWVAPLCYFIGIAAIIISGIMLKKTKLFSGTPAPFVMELPAYHLPTPINVLRSMWERGWSFIKKAGTVIMLSTVIIWAGTVFGVADGHFGLFLEMPEGGMSILDYIGTAIGWIFAPLGFSNPTAAVATLMGLIAKEEVVAVFGVADFAGLGKLAGFSFLVFNLLCAPCFAAMGAIRREMNNGKWTAFAITYQCLFAYAISLIIYQFGLLFTGAMGGINILWLVIAALLAVGMLVQLFRPYKESGRLTQTVKIK
ncbi:MAG: ferrous iron transporter B [Clostridia bacterium]|nr:ferrous iron transporter B [Clostridia bacterium]